MTELQKYEQRFADVVSKIDWDKVERAIVGDLPIMDFDLIDVKACVFAACERWLIQDIDNFQDITIESVIRRPGFKAYLDVRGVMTGAAKEFKAYKGKRFIVDWKSTKGLLDSKWKDRLLRSTQWRMYAWAEQEMPALFMYRGIRRPAGGVGGMAPETKDLCFDPGEYTQGNTAYTQLQIDGLTVMRNALIIAGLEIWPRHMPDACTSYGQQCPYFADCDLGTMPTWVPPTGKDMSYSRWKSFQECPERSRRNLMPGAPDGGSDATRFGSCVHQGLAEVYSQVFKVPVLTREEQELDIPEENE